MIKTVYGSYAKGRRFEYRVKKYLEKQGYFVVRVAKSGFPDLIAMPTSKTNPRAVWEEQLPLILPLLVECKWRKFKKPEARIKAKSDIRELVKNVFGIGAIAYNDEKGHLVFEVMA